MRCGGNVEELYDQRRGEVDVMRSEGGEEVEADGASLVNGLQTLLVVIRLARRQGEQAVQEWSNDTADDGPGKYCSLV